MTAYLENTSSRIFLIDASIYIFRAWHIYPDTITDSDGRPINALYGFLYFLSDFLRRVEPRHVAIAFDGNSRNCFRKRLYPAYKANREPAPQALKYQFGLCFRIARKLGFKCLKCTRYEADDLIATMADRFKQLDFGVTVVSADKDLAQVMADEHDFLWDFARDEVYDANRIEDKFGVRPGRIPELLALAGDKVDNIPGVHGIGIKTAARLLKKYPNLDELLSETGVVLTGRARSAARINRSIIENRESVRLYHRLTRLVREADVGPHAGCEWRCPGRDQIDGLMNEYQIDNILRARFSRFTADPG